MSNLALFQFKGNEIRFIDGKPVANDVAAVLGYADPAKTVSTKVKPKNRSVTKMVTLDGKLRDVSVLEEAGIYQLIFGSKLESAEQFQDWVFEEVLPSIRKTGTYSLPTQPPSDGFFWQRLIIYVTENAPQVPPGYFTIFRECLDLVADLEGVGCILPDDAIPDISVGMRWASYLRTQGIEPDKIALPYPHTYPDELRGTRYCKAYPENLLPLFRQWFRETYKPQHLPEYVKKRHTYVLPSVAKLLGLDPAKLAKGLKAA